MNHFLIDDVLAAASPERARGSKLTVEDVVRSAGEHVEKTLGDQPDAEAAVHNAIGTTLVRMGLYAEAEAHLRKALAQSSKTLGPEAPDTIEVMNNLAQLLKDRGKLDEAESCSAKRSNPTPEVGPRPSRRAGHGKQSGPVAATARQTR